MASHSSSQALIDDRIDDRVVSTKPIIEKPIRSVTQLELKVSLPQGHERLAITGTAEQNLKIIRESLSVQVLARNGTLRISGQSHLVRQAAVVVERLIAAAKQDRPLTRQALLDTIASVGRTEPSADLDSDDRVTKTNHSSRHHGLNVYLTGRRIGALTERQQTYLDAMREHDLTFCTGPAGTGKTYLAVATAVSMLKQGRVRKLALVRPAVEAGEKLGYLPGNMHEKVNPYLRPLLDALHDMMEFDQIQHFMSCDVIEIVPLAFMRGRTLNDAVIILDEAQNTTRSQMLMFLTRLGHGGKMIVTGDTSQTDLNDANESGLVDALRRLRRVSGVAMVTLQPADIVRHNLVQRVVEAYGRTERNEGDRRHEGTEA